MAGDARELFKIGWCFDSCDRVDVRPGCKDASNCARSHLSHFSHAVSNILRSAVGGDGVTDQEKRSCNALPSENLSRISLRLFKHYVRGAKGWRC